MCVHICAWGCPCMLKPVKEYKLKVGAVHCCSTTMTPCEEGFISYSSIWSHFYENFEISFKYSSRQAVTSIWLWVDIIHESATIYQTTYQEMDRGPLRMSFGGSSCAFHSVKAYQTDICMLGRKLGLVRSSTYVLLFSSFKTWQREIKRKR